MGTYQASHCCVCVCVCLVLAVVKQYATLYRDEGKRVVVLFVAL